MPTYQRSDLLQRAINSLLNQSFTNFQISIFDNCSSDDTEKIVREIMKKDSRILYHRHDENIGMLKNYEFALSTINTPYFSILSDDDIVHPHFYQTALEGFQKCPNAGFSACGIDIIDDNDTLVSNPLELWEREGIYDAPFAMLEMLNSMAKFPVPTGIVFQHRFVKNIQPQLTPKMQLMWDPDYLIQISAQHPVVLNKKVCGIFYTHSNGFSSEASRALFASAKSLEMHLESYIGIIDRIRINTHLSIDAKIQGEKTFILCIRELIAGFMNFYLNKLMFEDVIFTKKVLQKKLGIDSKINKIYIYALIGKYLRLYPLIINLQKLISRVINLYKNKQKFYS